jgi:hypothetical protein
MCTSADGLVKVPYLIDSLIGVEWLFDPPCMTLTPTYERDESHRMVHDGEGIHLLPSHALAQAIAVYQKDKGSLLDQFIHSTHLPGIHSITVRDMKYPTAIVPEI